MRSLLLSLCLMGSLAACASSSRDQGGGPGFDGDPGFTNPGEDTEQPIEKDRGYALVDDVVYFDGEPLGTIILDPSWPGGGKLLLVDDSGIVIARASKTGQGWSVVIEDSGGSQYKDYYHIVKNGEGQWTIDWANSNVDYDWGVPAEGIGVPELSAAQRDSAQAKANHLRNTLRHNRELLNRRMK